MPSKKEDTSNAAATLNAETQRALSQVLQDIRTTVAHLCVPGVSPLAVLDGTAVDALKDMYYIVNTEDPLNAMPARRLVLEQRVVKSALLPLVNAVHSDPTAQRNQKRWSVPMYQTLRLLSVLSIPVAKDNEFLKPGCNLDSYLLKLRSDFAQDRSAIHAFVALLQYYIERKAEKQAALAAAEESKLEDARIDNILRFFRNILSPPRAHVGDDITARDQGVHLALVAALVDSDFYSTIAILFSSKEDAAAQYTDLVFLVADIYAQTYRHSTPRQMYKCYREGLHKHEVINLDVDEDPKEPLAAPKPTSVFAETPQPAAQPIPVTNDLRKQPKVRSRSSNIRAALQRERTFIGGSRSVTKSARWSSRFSGGFVAKSSASSASGDQQETVDGQRSDSLNTSDSTARNTSSKRVVSAQNAIQSRISLNPLRPFQDNVKMNSDILCMFAAKGRTQVMKTQTEKSSLSNTMRKDLQEEGLKGILTLTAELVDVCFDHLMREMRGRIEDTKSRSLGDEAEALMKAQRAFLCIVGSVVGFQREKYGKVFKHRSNDERSLAAQLHENCMKSVLASDFKIVRKEWRPIEAGIEVETFRLIFRILIESCESVKTDSKDDKKIQDVELSTFAVLEMMKMLQGMAANRHDEDEEFDVQDGDKLLNDIRNNNNNHQLTPRETALNTIEQLFEQQEYLNAPADLAKDYTSKVFSFRHLTNIVEVTHAFTTILLDEQELARLQVARKKRARKARKREVESSKKALDEEDGETDKVTAEPKSDDNVNGTPTGRNEEVIDEEDLLRKLAGVERKGSGTLQAGLESQAVEPGSATAKATAEEGSQQPDGNHSPDKEPDSRDRHKHTLPEGDTPNTEGKDTSTKANRPEQEETPQRDVDSEASDEDALGEPELREVESVGIIRRFAHAKAVQTLLLPIRAAISNASSLSGSIYNVPDGCGPMLSPVVTAKSAHVLAAIWRVAKVKERGAMCGQFFTFSSMHLMGLALEAAGKDAVLKESVMERFSVFARDVTRCFFSWIALSPGMTLDMFFPMDKGSCHQYMTSARQRDAVLQDRNEAADSGNDSDISALVVSRHGNLDFEQVERRVSERKARRDRTSTQLRKNVVERRRERGSIEEDEDVDDLDNLNLGNGLESSESDDSEADDTLVKEPQEIADKERAVQENKPKDTPFCRLPASKRRRAQRSFDPFASDDEVLESKIRKKPPKKPKKATRIQKEKKEPKQTERIYCSSDEYGEADLKLTDSEQDGGANKTQGRQKEGRRVRLDWEDSSEESDNSGAALEKAIRCVASDGEDFPRAKESISVGLSHERRVSNVGIEITKGDGNDAGPRHAQRGVLSDVSKSRLPLDDTTSDAKHVQKREAKRRKLVLSNDDSE